MQLENMVQFCRAKDIFLVTLNLADQGLYFSLQQILALTTHTFHMYFCNFINNFENNITIYFEYFSS